MFHSFHQQFDRHGTWRQEVALRLQALSEWLQRSDLMDDVVRERLHRLIAQMRSDKVLVAFVAELSRGKSELINALFFSGYGQRIVPANVGRTTMCPTELGYDDDVPPCIRLLPIETRRGPQALSEWRACTDAWLQINFDANDAAGLATAVERVTEVQHVLVADAQALGFWSEEPGADNPVPDACGMVEVPRWRHALINIAHPLLRQGLVILDTPGLNAMGVELELTVNMIPHAHAVLFVLAADAGVTRSDLAIWREHLAVDAPQVATRLVVLNKIDALWDSLSTPEQVDQKIVRQIASVAETLGLPAAQVLPVSAQKGLIGKINQDAELLAASRLPQLETALSEGILGQRRQVLRSVVATGLEALRTDVVRRLDLRRRELSDSQAELNGLRGKNASVIDAMSLRVHSEQQHFAAAELATAGVYSAHARSMQNASNGLDAQSVERELHQLSQALRDPSVLKKLGAAAIYRTTFARLRAAVDAARAMGAQSRAALANAMKQLNTEHGLTLSAMRAPELAEAKQRLALIEYSHVRQLGLINVMRLMRSEFVAQLLRALSLQLQLVFEGVRADLDLWSRGSLLQIEAQLRERRQGIERRVQAIDRVRDAADSLDARIAEIDAALAGLNQLDTRMVELSAYVVKPAEPAVQGVRTPQAAQAQPH